MKSCYPSISIVLISSVAALLLSRPCNCLPPKYHHHHHHHHHHPHQHHHHHQQHSIDNNNNSTVITTATNSSSSSSLFISSSSSSSSSSSFLLSLSTLSSSSSSSSSSLSSSALTTSSSSSSSHTSESKTITTTTDDVVGDRRIAETLTKIDAPRLTNLAVPAASSSMELPDKSQQATGTDTNKGRVDPALLKAVKNDLLRNLGLRKVPDVSRINQTVEEKRTKIRLFRQHLIAKHTLHEHYDTADYTNDMSHSFHCSDFPRENEKSKVGEANNNPNLVFAMKIQHPKNPLMETVIRSAKLHIFKRGGKMAASNESSSLHSELEVNVYHVTVDSNPSETIRTLVDTKIIDLSESGWVIFNIQQALQHWLDGPTKKDGLLRLQLSSKACTKDLHHIFQVNRLMKRSLRDQEPRLNVKTSERLILGRVKRDSHTGDCVKGDGETQCCRFPLKIDFKEFNWDDWVIAPTSFNAYYCKGDCGNNRLANDWAYVKRLIHKTNPSKMPVDVCCVPNKYKGLILLHYNNDGQLTLSERETMVVEDCRCR